jgi:type IV pilus assembly protein PilF
VPPNYLKPKLRYALALLIATSLNSCALFTEQSAERADYTRIHLQLGVRYLEMNKLELAKENLLLAVEQDPNNVQVQNSIAFLYEKLNNTQLANRHYQTALNLVPDDWSVQNNYGRFLCEHGKNQQGLELLTKAIATPLNDKPWLALTNAGRCQETVQQAQNAETYFKQALNLNNSYAPALLEMQKISYLSADYGTAKIYLQRYLAVAEQTASSLWFALHTEQALGNDSLAKHYQKELLEKFPLSEEAKKSANIKDF